MRKALVLLAITYLTGCVATMNVPTGPDKGFQDAAAFVKEKKYSEAIVAYKKIVAASPASALAADSLFELAVIRTLHDNPQRDYVQAIHAFEEFIRQHPGHGRTPEAQSWIYALRQVLDLKKENEHLKKNIEQLKRLDIRHEERRRQ